jgi:hypothetical protein
MTIEQLIAELMEVIANYGEDPEAAHGMMDDLLIAYINDKRVTDLWNEQERWYS